MEMVAELSLIITDFLPRVKQECKGDPMYKKLRKEVQTGKPRCNARGQPIVF